jgi:hypothetical protein
MLLKSVLDEPFRLLTTEERKIIEWPWVEGDLSLPAHFRNGEVTSACCSVLWLYCCQQSHQVG